jgi:DNA-binding XRE family transcriptional regulator
MEDNWTEYINDIMEHYFGDRKDEYMEICGRAFEEESNEEEYSEQDMDKEVQKKTKKVTLPEETEEILVKLGKNIHDLRLCYYYSLERLADHAGISRTTLWKIEKGDATVTIGAYAAVLYQLDRRDVDILRVGVLPGISRLAREMDTPYKHRAPRKWPY